MVTLLVVVLVLPLQVAAEELVFRGFGPQLIQGRTGSSLVTFWVSHTVFALLFASLHGSSGFSGWLLFLVLGLVLSVLVRLTGGLEASVALHAVNNVSVFAIGALRDTDAAAKQGNVALGGAELGQLAAFVVVAGAIWALHASGRLRS